MLSKCNKVLASVGRLYPRTCQQCGLGPCGEGYEEATPDLVAKSENVDAFFAAHPDIGEKFAAWQAGRVGRWLGEAMGRNDMEQSP